MPGQWAGVGPREVPKQPCAVCQRRPATTRWTSGGALDVSHGLYTWRCGVCVLEAQVAHAQERAAALPVLEAQLAEALEASP